MKHLIQKILKSLSLKKKKKGFSLIELMIVLAIIGFLTAMAVPNFLRFQLKAKQSEAKSQLGALYMAEKSFFSEWNTFYADFRDIGYEPEGRLTYHIALVAGTHMIPTEHYSYADGSCAPTAMGAIVCTPAQFTTTVYCGTMGAGNGECTELDTATAPTTATAMVTATAFTAIAGANLDTDADVDEWSIDEDKRFVNHDSDL